MNRSPVDYDFKCVDNVLVIIRNQWRRSWKMPSFGFVLSLFFLVRRIFLVLRYSVDFFLKGRVWIRFDKSGAFGKG